MSAISLIKIPPGDGNKKIGTSCEVTKSKPKSEIISLRVPNRHSEGKESSIPYFYCVIKQKRKKKRRKITVLTVPNLKETVEVENYKEEFVSVPIVQRLSLEELKKWCVKERKQKQKGGSSSAFKALEKEVESV